VEVWCALSEVDFVALVSAVLRGEFYAVFFGHALCEHFVVGYVLVRAMSVVLRVGEVLLLGVVTLVECIDVELSVCLGELVFCSVSEFCFVLELVDVLFVELLFVR